MVVVVVVVDVVVAVVAPNLIFDHIAPPSTCCYRRIVGVPPIFVSVTFLPGVVGCVFSPWQYVSQENGLSDFDPGSSHCEEAVFEAARLQAIETIRYNHEKSREPTCD